MKTKTIELQVIPKWVETCINKTKRSYTKKFFRNFKAYDIYIHILYSIREGIVDYDNYPNFLNKNYEITSKKGLEDRLIWWIFNADDILIAIKYGYEVEDG